MTEEELMELNKKIDEWQARLTDLSARVQGRKRRKPTAEDAAIEMESLDLQAKIEDAYMLLEQHRADTTP